MEEDNKHIVEERFVDNPGEAVNAKFESRFSWGLVVLVGGCIWAVFELIDSILFFF